MILKVTDNQYVRLS